MSNKKRKNSNYITKKTPATATSKKSYKKLIAIIATLLLAVIVLTSVLLVIGCNKDEGGYVTPKAGEGGACSYLTLRSVKGRDIKFVRMDVKDYGSVVILLDATTAPKTVENFVMLVNRGFYDGLTFHRVMEGFMIQGGDPNANGSGSSGKQIKGEFDLNGHPNDIYHVDGVISMARGNDYDSASCQFFICNATGKNVTYSLDGKYAAFGYVVAGLDVVHEITKNTVRYAGNNGAISDKKHHAVIERIVVLDSYELTVE